MRRVAIFHGVIRPALQLWCAQAKPTDVDRRRHILRHDNGRPAPNSLGGKRGNRVPGNRSHG